MCKTWNSFSYINLEVGASRILQQNLWLSSVAITCTCRIHLWQKNSWEPEKKKPYLKCEIKTGWKGILHNRQNTVTATLLSAHHWDRLFARLQWRRLVSLPKAAPALLLPEAEGSIWKVGCLEFHHVCPVHQPHRQLYTLKYWSLDNNPKEWYLLWLLLLKYGSKSATCKDITWRSLLDIFPFRTLTQQLFPGLGVHFQGGGHAQAKWGPS